jgi:hypothetical protein
MSLRTFLFVRGWLHLASRVEGATRAPVIEFCAMKIVTEYFKK